MEKESLAAITTEFSKKSAFSRNNTYKNNNTDKDGRAGGLAWLGYRLDMAGITRSNRVRPTILNMMDLRWASLRRTLVSFYILYYIMNTKK
jgi:hypothetical protein